MSPSRDSTAIPGRESPAPKPAPTARPKRRRGRPRKDELRAKEPRRLKRQASMTLDADAGGPAEGLRHFGVKRNAKGSSGELDRLQAAHRRHRRWHSGQLPLTSASVPQSGGDPAGEADRGRVDSLYDLMDSAYDAPESGPSAKSWGMCRIGPQSPQAAAGESRAEAGGVGAAPHSARCLPKQGATGSARPWSG